MKSVYFKIVMILFFAFFSDGIWAADQSVNLDKEIADIRYRVTAIEHDFDNTQNVEKIQAFNKVIDKADVLIEYFPDRSEPYLWKGIALSAQAKHKGKGFAALRSVRQARKYLLMSIKMDPSVAGGAAYNALAMLYYKVPPWPIGFGSRKKAEESFQKALAVSSNLDTNYRYGEFLIMRGQVKEGLDYLKQALSFKNRLGRKEDPLKKLEILKLIKEHKHEK